MSSRNRSMWQVALVMMGIHGAWAFSSLVIHVSGLVFPGVLSALPVHFLSLSFFIILASVSTGIFLVYAEPVLKERHRMRLGLVCSCVCLSAIFYLCVCLRAGASGPVNAGVFYVLNSANLVIFANLVGAWIIHPVRRPPELVPLALVLFLVDLFSVFRGPSRRIAESITNYYSAGMEGPPPVVDFILLKIIVPGADYLPPVFGLSDWIIVSFFAAASARFGFNDNLAGKSLREMIDSARPGVYLPVSAAGLFAAVLLAGVLGIFLPALPIIVFFYMGYVLVRYAEVRRLTPSDWRLTIGAAAILFVLGSLVVRGMGG